MINKKLLSEFTRKARFLVEDLISKEPSLTMPLPVKLTINSSSMKLCDCCHEVMMFNMLLLLLSRADKHLVSQEVESHSMLPTNCEMKGEGLIPVEMIVHKPLFHSIQYLLRK